MKTAPTPSMPTPRRPPRPTRPEHVCQLLIVLANTDPLVWRRIQVPASYSFWDLHVAIQDAMGWKDCHLHEFVIVAAKTARAKRIGIPDDEMPDERPCVAGWKVPIERYLTHGSAPVRYRYDFGDGWDHTLEIEDLLPADGGTYPRCVAGAGACPPEDVGGTRGYAEFLRTIQNSRHPERAAMLEWAGGSFNPLAFDPHLVEFDDPRQRWRLAFEAPLTEEPIVGRMKIAEGQPIEVVFTDRERTLVAEHAFPGPELAAPLDAAERRGTSLVARYTLDDLDELLGFIAAAANHTKNRKLEKELRALFARLTDEMNRYDDGQ